ncbi:MAG TPA: FG-GAP-like repeat-containing protein [Candidatus Angelobacter sp.]|nr:FG-GAP-like repeat-containing protein [Candidatus Angelobacter sp.]
MLKIVGRELCKLCFSQLNQPHWTKPANRLIQNRQKCHWGWLLIFHLVAVFCAAQTVRPTLPNPSVSRIMQAIDDTDTVRISNTAPRVLQRALDQGRLPSATRMQNLILVLKPGPEQEHALTSLLDQQQDKNSPNYHHWLTPNEFGLQFGMASSDLQKISDWLAQEGFVIEDIGHGHTSVVFSGRVEQVEKAFHTEIHRYLVDGEQHFSNSTDIAIPTALNPVVANVLSLSDFKPKPMHTVARAANQDQIIPTFTSGQSHGLSPGDFAVIYRTQPLLDDNFDGTGVKIGIISLSNVNPVDMQNFRDTFFPGRPVNVPALFTPGGDPGNTGDKQEEEADLDLEWAGGTAPGATIINFASLTLEIAARYAVDTNFVDIISMSYGSCEQPSSDLYQLLWSQAAAEGITVFVSSGDSGSADCDSASAPASLNGYAVNRFASTPFNVAVGGTEFHENGNNSLYWSSTNNSNQASALGYIPEVVWSESCFNGTATGNGLDCDSGAGLWSAGGGVSMLYSKPPWQTGPGVPAQDPISVSSVIPGPHRYLPDVSLTAAQHDAYLVCSEVPEVLFVSTGNCHDDTPATAISMGGTSAAAPAFAGIQAIINQKYGRQGQTAYVYYNLAAKQNTAICNSTGTTPPDSSCIFNDITSGSNGIPCEIGSTNCPSTGVLANFSARPGYDLATGLGSVNATNLFNQWQTATPRSTSLVLKVISPASGVASIGQPVTFSASLSVPGGAWGPVPGGAVAFFDGTTQLGSLSPALDIPTLNYVVTFTATFSATGEHVIKAQYTSNSSASYLASISSPVSVFVQQPVTLPSLVNLTSTPTTISGGQSAILTATLDGPAPAGGALITLSSSDSGAFPTPAGITILPGQATGNSVAIIAGNLAVATNVTVIGIYNGTAKTAAVIVNPASKVSLSVSLAASQPSAAPGQTVTFTAVVSGATGPAPTGLISFRDVFNNVATLVCSQPFIASPTAGQYTATCSEQLLSTGLHALVAIYNGDAVYGSALSNVANVNVQQQSSGPVLANLTITPATITGGLMAQGAVTLTGPAPANAVVSFESNNPQFVPVPPSVTVTQGFNSRAFPIATNFTSGIVGATITAHYNGTVAGAGITVLPVAVSGVSFFPSIITAGTPALFTVFLTGPAPAGTFVSLTSSNPAVLQVPANVAMTPGTNSVSVNGTTTAVVSQTTVTLTASYNLSSSLATLTVTPAPPLTLNNFGVNAQTVTGGSSVTGTVGLSAPAPAGGANVTISSSSNLIASGPVNIPTGSVFAPFSFATSAVSTITNVVLTASFGGVSQDLTITLVPPLPFVASLSFSPSTVDSGITATGTVTLTAPAPLGGVSPLLTSSTQAGIAFVPFNISIPFGSTTGTFSVHTAPIGFVAQLPVTVSFNGTSASSVLTIVPPGTPLAPASVAFNPTQITGGTSSTGTIALTGLAPNGGALVFIASDNTNVTIPPSVTVPAGANSASFTVQSIGVQALSTATIRASLNGVSQSTLLTLVPATPGPSLNPVPLLVDPLSPLSQVPTLNRSTLTVNGSGFMPGSQIFWNGAALPTGFVSTSKLQAPIQPSNINGSAIVQVKNSGPISAASNSLPVHLGYPRKNLSFSNALLATSNTPDSVIAVDLNGDGNLDLVIARDLGVSVFLGNGDGTFGPELILPAIATAALVAADFNGDGKPDIGVIVNVDNTHSALRVFLGNGDGTFTTLPDIPVDALATNGTLAAGDINGDGKLDLVVADNDFPHALLMIGKGDGTFQAPVSIGTVNSPLSVALADLNADGHLDVVLSDSQNMSVAVLLGNGDGTFQPQKEYTTNGNAVAIVIADFNGDDHPDIAVANEGPVGGAGGGAAVLLNNGNGTFTAPAIYSPGQEFFAIATDDVDGDGKLDLVLMAGIGTPHSASIFLGDGAGAFAASPVIVPLALSSSLLTIADINNDGAPDFLVANTINGGGIGILLQSAGPILHVAPENLLFNVTQGSSVPPLQQLAISNTGDGAEPWSITISQPWIIVTPAAGNAPGSVDISVNPAGLAVGTYTGVVTVAAGSASNSPATTQISLEVDAIPVVVSSLAFSSTSINAPGSVTGTVILSSPAQTIAGVALQSDNASVQVPSTVSIASGALSATFPATILSVQSQTVATVTATYNNITTSANLAVNPGSDFSFAVASGTPISQTVTAGTPATYNLQLNPQNGFTGQVTLGCSVAPAGPVCAVNPVIANITGSAVSVSVTVSTTRRSATISAFPSTMQPRFAVWSLTIEYALALLGLLATVVCFRRRKWRAVSLAGFMALLMSVISCGGNTPTPQPGTGGTPPGTYSISVTGTSGATSRNIVLSLTVQ